MHIRPQTLVRGTCSDLQISLKEEIKKKQFTKQIVTKERTEWQGKSSREMFLFSTYLNDKKICYLVKE